jgi:aryl-alcohol dehydrogenase-like predicted oxidoreductase
MEYTVLGRTGLRVSRVGCGGGGIGQVWGPTMEAESVRTIHRALELGVNFFDVAPGYGQGKAEEVLGRALQGRQEQVVVATKVRLATEAMHEVAGGALHAARAPCHRGREHVPTPLLVEGW